MTQENKVKRPPIPLDDKGDKIDDKGDKILDAKEFADALTKDHAAFPTQAIGSDGRLQQRGVAHSMVLLEMQERITISKLYEQIKNCKNNKTEHDEKREELTTILENAVTKGLDSLPKRIERLRDRGNNEIADRLAEITTAFTGGVSFQPEDIEGVAQHFVSSWPRRPSSQDCTRN